MPRTLRPLRSAGGFDFTGAMRALCRDVAARTPELAHVDVDRVGVVFAQARKRVLHGLFASLTPLRFAGGAEIAQRGRRRYAAPRLLDETGRELLYLLTFYLPRYLDLPFEEKLVTVFHELWHIGPAFDGDIRRHEGRCYAHSGSQQAFDAWAAELARRWLAAAPPPEQFAFLHENFASLSRRHGRIHGLRASRPRLIPLP